MRFERLAKVAILALAAGCTGELVEPGGERRPSGGGPPPGPTVDDKQRETNPSLFSVASKYFPGQSGGAGKKAPVPPDAHAARPHDQDALARALQRQRGRQPCRAIRCRPTTSTPTTSASTRRTSRPTPTGSTRSPTACRPTRRASSTARRAATRRRASTSRPRAFVTRAFRGVVTDAQLARYAALLHRAAWQRSGSPTRPPTWSTSR